MPTNRRRSKRNSNNDKEQTMRLVVLYGSDAIERWIPDRLDAAGYIKKDAPEVGFYYSILDTQHFIEPYEWRDFFDRHPELMSRRSPEDRYTDAVPGVKPAEVRKAILDTFPNLSFDLLVRPALPMHEREAKRR